MGTTFGFSAFLKLVSLNQRPRLTEMRKRLAPAQGGGYDFHKATRELLHRLRVDRTSLEQLIAEAEQITNPYERSSAVATLKKFHAMGGELGSLPVELPEFTYESPAGAFRVRFQPDFGAIVSERRMGVHTWNNKEPALDARLARAALSLFGPQFADSVDDLAVLDLRKSILINMGDPARHVMLADRMVSYVEETLLELRSGRLGRELIKGIPAQAMS